MRPIERIPKLLELIKEKWEESPDQRFGQLLINLGVCPDNLQFWNLQDDIIIKHLEKKKQNGM